MPARPNFRCYSSSVPKKRSVVPKQKMNILIDMIPEKTEQRAKKERVWNKIWRRKLSAPAFA